jgi:hypothetical protein
MNDQLEMLSQREQLMEDIDAIVDGFFNDHLEQYQGERDDLTRILCDAVCTNFPIN